MSHVQSSNYFLRNGGLRLLLFFQISGLPSIPYIVLSSNICLPIQLLIVLTSGMWLAPGDSEEVAAALSQALRNCIERLYGRAFLFVSIFKI